MQAFSAPSVSHGKHRCFTEANGAFQAGQNGRRRAHYIAKANRENFACLGSRFDFNAKREAGVPERREPEYYIEIIRLFRPAPSFVSQSEPRFLNSPTAATINPTEHHARRRIGLNKETKMPQRKSDPITGETGEQVPARPHDSGSAANETVDGLDAITEAVRHAAEDTPSGASPDDVEKVPVFDRANLAPKI
jgi:hypothetical protein